MARLRKSCLYSSSTEAYSGGGLSPPGPVKSIDFRGFSGPNGCWAPPPRKEKKFKPLPGQIPEYAPERLLFGKTKEVGLKLWRMIVRLAIVLVWKNKVWGRLGFKGQRLGEVGGGRISPSLENRGDLSRNYGERTTFGY